MTEFNSSLSVVTVFVTTHPVIRLMSNNNQMQFLGLAVLLSMLSHRFIDNLLKKIKINHMDTMQI